MEKGIKGDQERFGDAVGDDVQWVFSGKKRYCEGMLIALANSRSMRGASHHPTYMTSCLTISHKCFPCLPSGRKLFLD